MSFVTRRAALAGLAAAPLALQSAHAQAPSLPLAPTFIEHLGTVVADPAAAATFHSRLFNPAIMTERNPTPPRFYVDLKPGYLAFGSRPDEPRAFFDHFCVLIEGYDQAALAETLAAEGLPQNNPAFTLFPDPDGIGVQLYGHPGGWFPTVVPGEPFVEGPALVTPKGLDAVVLRVADLDRSIGFYHRVFGVEARREDDGLAWIGFPDTRLGLRLAVEGEEPGIDHIRIRVRVAQLDVDSLSKELEALGATVAPPGAGGALGFEDPQGLKLVLVAV